MSYKKILVVDDDEKIVGIVRAYLEKEGYKVLTAYDGNTAIDMAQKQNPDLIVLDLMLPDIDGYEVLRRLRAARVQTPILILSGLSGLDDLPADRWRRQKLSLSPDAEVVLLSPRAGNGPEKPDGTR